jgi:hypothetical protein
VSLEIEKREINLDWWCNSKVKEKKNPQNHNITGYQEGKCTGSESEPCSYRYQLSEFLSNTKDVLAILKFIRLYFHRFDHQVLHRRGQRPLFAKFVYHSPLQNWCKRI